MPGPVSQSHPGPPEAPEILTCAFCGEEYPPGTPRSQHELLTEHVHQCAAHPLNERIRELEKVKERFAEEATDILSELSWEDISADTLAEGVRVLVRKLREARERLRRVRESVDTFVVPGLIVVGVKAALDGEIGGD
ncbi:hypothetical protein ACFL59_11925 [Planctomycetota bacterium]